MAAAVQGTGSRPAMDGKYSVRLATVLPCSADVAWDIVGDFFSVAWTGPLIAKLERIERPGDPAGIWRRATDRGGMSMDEKLLFHSDSHREYFYWLPDGFLGAMDYVGHFQVTPLQGRRGAPPACVLTWNNSWTFPGGDEQEAESVADMMRAAGRAALRYAAKAVTAAGAESKL